MVSRRHRLRRKRVKKQQPIVRIDSDAESIELVIEEMTFDQQNKSDSQFLNVITRFQGKMPVNPLKEEQESTESKLNVESIEVPSISKKRMRKLSRMSLIELKTKTGRSDIVEWVDVTAPDPFFLIYLKSLPNTVPVPPHWCQKRKYLQAKRGIVKPPFILPEFIQNTGITELRDNMKNKDRYKTLKSRIRSRLQPKLGKLDMDYEKLHDAFFRYQTKPKMSKFGDLYYEGKELEIRFDDKIPGIISEELRVALGMPDAKGPPPWLINLQRYGPPPSYPYLKLPGVNYPIPPCAEWGYQTGGWGKPPIDEFNRPLYGDIFGVMNNNTESISNKSLKHELWGEPETIEFEEFFGNEEIDDIPQL
jgi:splicing factor 3B subunit 2